MIRRVLPHAEAQKILQPHYEKISNAILEGFADYLKLAKCSTENIGYIEYEVRTKACLVHDHIKNRIKTAFHDVEGVKTGEWRGIFALKVGDDLFIRFNKINTDYSTTGYRTKQSKAYQGQRIIDGLPDEPTFLYAGYDPDPSWTQISGVYVTCWKTDGLVWVQELLSNKGLVQTSLQFEQPKEQPKRRVKIKNNKNTNNKPNTKTGTND